jgi:5-methyltetrahydrofolate--homocysteine methyltransferase
LIAAGLQSGACGELWNLTQPDRVLAIHRAYVQAGADCIITNTFGGNRITLRRREAAGQTREINRAAARIAREGFDGRPGFVLGDIGPLGEMLEPYGELSLADAQAAFKEQAGALVEADVDAIIIETQTSLGELGLAIDASLEAGAKAVIASLAYDLLADKTSYATMMGVTPQQAARFIEKRGAHVAALNCGAGMDMAGAAKVAAIYGSNCALPVMVQPNAGLPILEGGRTVYKQQPKDMAAGVPQVLAAGANIVGSCCGSGPEHTRAIGLAVAKCKHELYNYSPIGRNHPA